MPILQPGDPGYDPDLYEAPHQESEENRKARERRAEIWQKQGEGDQIWLNNEARQQKEGRWGTSLGASDGGGDEGYEIDETAFQLTDEQEEMRQYWKDLMAGNIDGAGEQALKHGLGEAQKTVRGSAMSDQLDAAGAARRALGAQTDLAAKGATQVALMEQQEQENAARARQALANLEQANQMALEGLRSGNWAQLLRAEATRYTADQALKGAKMQSKAMRDQAEMALWGSIFGSIGDIATFFMPKPGG